MHTFPLFQLVEQMGDMRLDRGLADVEAFGDLAAGLSLGHLELALGEYLDLLGFAMRWLRASSELLDEPASYGGREQRVPRRFDSDRAVLWFGCNVEGSSPRAGPTGTHCGV